MKSILPIVALVLALAAPVRAQEEEGEVREGGAVAEVAEGVAAIRAELTDVEQQIKALEERLIDLEQKRIILEDRLAGERKETEAEMTLRAIKADSAERLAAHEAELDELKERETNEDEPVGVAWKEYAENRREHLRTAADIERRIQELEGPEAIERAEELLWQLERHDTHWWMVSEPKHGRAVELEEMENAALARDEKALFELIRKVRAAHLEDVERGQKLYELWLERARSDREVGKMIQAFWGFVESAEEKQEAQGAGERPDLRPRSAR
jgi:hypothetical protein